MKAIPLHARPIRSLFGALIAAGAWGLLGVLLASKVLGVLLAIWSLVLGPLLMPTFLWFALRLQGRLRPLDYAREAGLARAYFECILRRPGPRPEIWVLGSADKAVFWFESLLRSKQIVIVTSGWLAGDEVRRCSELRGLWELLAVSTRAQRSVRTLQVCLWLGAASPLSFLFFALQIVTDFFGFSDLPRPGFWFLGSAWKVRELWFGKVPGPTDAIVARSWGAGPPPRVWGSLLWGVWFQCVPERLHPSWQVLTRSDAFLST